MAMLICKTFLVALVSLSSVLVSQALPKQTFPVGSKQNPGVSCLDIKEHGGVITKNYYITLGGFTLQVHCDQTTEGGGWTLVYSYTFRDFEHFGHGSNAVIPKPNWPALGDIPISTTPPKSETDYNAMDFNLWKKLGTELMIKSNINNWIACSDGTGSLVNWRIGHIRCKIVKDVTGKCLNIVPDSIVPAFYTTGPNFYDNRAISITMPRAYYFFEASSHGGFPVHSPCGVYNIMPSVIVPNPHGNIYVR